MAFRSTAGEGVSFGADAGTARLDFLLGCFALVLWPLTPFESFMAIDFLNFFSNFWNNFATLFSRLTERFKAFFPFRADSLAFLTRSRATSNLPLLSL